MLGCLFAADLQFDLPFSVRNLLPRCCNMLGVPLALFKRTRPYAIQGLMVTSFAVGLTTWFRGATVSFATFGFLGLFIGCMLMGVGVVFIGMVGAGMVMGDWELAFSLLVMSVLTYALRFAAVWLLTRTLPRPVVSPALAQSLLVGYLARGQGEEQRVGCAKSVPKECQMPTQEHPTPTKTKGRNASKTLTFRPLFDHDKRFLSPVRLPVSPPRHHGARS